MSATIYFQPLQVGLYEDRESHLLIDETLPGPDNNLNIDNLLGTYTQHVKS